MLAAKGKITKKGIVKFKIKLEYSVKGEKHFKEVRFAGSVRVCLSIINNTVADGNEKSVEPCYRRRRIRACCFEFVFMKTKF